MNRKRADMRRVCGIDCDRITETFARMVLLLLLLKSGSSSAAESGLRIPPTEPADAEKTIRLQDGFQADLIAAEPLVTDPVDMQYDENGLAYVIEMNDYPYSDPSKDQAWQEQQSPPLGRIRILEDTNADGVFDHATVFADSLSWPSGLAFWQGGVFVAATPTLWYFKDTDGDRRADLRRKVFLGFRKYNVQAVINNLRWGLDHRIYAAGSSNGGNIQIAAGGDSVRMGRSDFRFDPRSEQFELVSGGARFGNSFDPWGNRFVCTIRNPVQHVVMPANSLRKNEVMPVRTTLHNVAPAGDAIAVYPISEPEPWRVINAARQAANTATDAPYDSTVASGFVTSSSGVTIYRGAAYPADFLGNAFVGEVAGNLVIRYRLAPSGVSFAATRPYDKVEFLASTDNWFRPVNFVNAPDGTLNVLDMYRETIEHPWSMPEDLKAELDLTSGRDRGRIYRIRPPNFRPISPPKLGSASTQALVAELENQNGWWRETAHRLLFERQDASAVAPLRDILLQSQSPVARVYALWSLDGLERLTSDDLNVAFRDPSGRVREHAVMLSAARLGERSEFLESVLKVVTDPDPRVRFQVALALGDVRDERAALALAMIARRDHSDVWIRTAVVSSLTDSYLAFLTDVLNDQVFLSNPGAVEMIEQISTVLGTRHRPIEIQRVLHQLARRNGKQTGVRAVVAGLGTGLKRANLDLQFAIRASDELAAGTIASVVDQAIATTGDVTSAVPDREQAIELLSLCDFNTVSTVLADQIEARQPTRVQLAAIRALSSFRRPAVADVFLRRYVALTPSVQREIVTKLLTRSEWLPQLLEAIASGAAAAELIPVHRREILMQHPDPEIRDRARQLFEDEHPGPRKDVVADYQPSLSLPADPVRGAVLLKRECLSCHRWHGQGADIGPDLATIKHRSPGELLTQILDPNREVSPNFLTYVVVTRQGEILSGVIASETATSLTLIDRDAEPRTILRADIEEIQSTGKSAMPEGLEKKLSPQDLADVLACLKQNP